MVAMQEAVAQGAFPPGGIQVDDRMSLGRAGWERHGEGQGGRENTASTTILQWLIRGVPLVDLVWENPYLRPLTARLQPSAGTTVRQGYFYTDFLRSTSSIDGANGVHSLSHFFFFFISFFIFLFFWEGEGGFSIKAEHKRGICVIQATILPSPPALPLQAVVHGATGGSSPRLRGSDPTGRFPFFLFRQALLVPSHTP